MIWREIIADLIEPTLSGQYGREDAEGIADDIIRVLAMKEPKKWEAGLGRIGEALYWRGWYLYAETEKDAVRQVREGESNWPDDKYYYGARPWSERE